jgi:apoptosis-inducing factor 3
MGTQSTDLKGPDLTAGVKGGELREGELVLGHADGEAVILVKSAGDLFAVSATCSHYGGPLSEGLVADGKVHCPWHHACFDLRTGAAKGPALASISCFEVIREGDLVRVGRKQEPAHPVPKESPSSVVVVGGGTAGAACIETLRREGYGGKILLFGDEEAGAVDRPNLSKDFLAGTAPEEWAVLRGPDALAAANVEHSLGNPVVSIDVEKKTVKTRSGREVGYGALLLAMGAEASLLPIEGASLPHVHRLRSLEDSKAIIAKTTSKRAVVLGASFIGLEVAASLRHRGLEVTVVAPDAAPLAHVLGEEVGAFIRKLHESHGVSFRLGRKPASITPTEVVLDDGSRVPAELVVMGVGVRPRTKLAEAAGLKVDNGVVVDDHLRTSAADVYAAGDIARYPYDGSLVRIEHFALAVRQGQAVARTMLGSGSPFRDVPFFWSQHYDVTISYVGHVEKYDSVQVVEKDACVAYRKGGKVRAVATIGRDLTSLQVEHALESGDESALLRALQG